MSYLRHFFLLTSIFCLILISCKPRAEERIFTINPNKDYPEFDVPLNELFDIKIINLEGEEQNYFIQFILGRNLFIDDEHHLLFLTNWMGHLTSVGVFDLEGNFIRSIGKVGRGPGEFSSDHIAFLPLLDKEQVLVIDYYDGKFIRYDYTGHHIDTRRFDSRLFSHEWMIIKNTLLCFDRMASSHHMHSVLSQFDIESLNPIESKSFMFSRPYDAEGYLEYKVFSSGAVTTNNGVWLNPASCSDTTYFLQNDERIVPRIINLANNTAEHILSLVFESPEYLFCRYMDAEHWEKSFVIRKSDGAIFKISPRQLSFLTFHFDCATRDGQHCILDMSEILYPDELIALDPDAKPLIESFDEEGNPLLVLFTLK